MDTCRRHLPSLKLVRDQDGCAEVNRKSHHLHRRTGQGLFTDRSDLSGKGTGVYQVPHHHAQLTRRPGRVCFAFCDDGRIMKELEKVSGQYRHFWVGSAL